MTIFHVKELRDHLKKATKEKVTAIAFTDGTTTVRIGRIAFNKWIADLDMPLTMRLEARNQPWANRLSIDGERLQSVWCDRCFMKRERCDETFYFIHVGESA